jgi:phosphoribosyl-ATP pyrophosphohydrolase/phosphoribosyl-AMP cyclohydrolase
MIDTNSLDFEKGDGLIPAIIQDANNFQVLMLGYMNKKALEKTLEEERVTFYSRTKQRLWTKGESSGNYLDVVNIQQDCDDDTLLILAKPQGPTCHTGEQSCFHQKDFKPEQDLHFLNNLEELIISRKKEMPEGSYTTSLFNDGIDKIAQKVGEEAVETVIEAKNENHSLVDEVSDLIYHLLVLLVEKGVPLQKIVQNLEKRHGK